VYFILSYCLYLFGFKETINSYIFHRPFSNNYTPTTVERFAANSIELIGVSIMIGKHYYYLNNFEK